MLVAVEPAVTGIGVPLAGLQLAHVMPLYNVSMYPSELDVPVSNPVDVV